MKNRLRTIFYSLLGIACLVALFAYGTDWRVECDARSGWERTIHRVCFIPFTGSPGETLLSRWAQRPDSEPKWVKVKGSPPPGVMISYCFDRFMRRLETLDKDLRDNPSWDGQTKQSIANHFLDSLEAGIGICVLSRRAESAMESIVDKYDLLKSMTSKEILHLFTNATASEVQATVEATAMNLNPPNP